MGPKGHGHYIHILYSSKFKPLNSTQKLVCFTEKYKQPIVFLNSRALLIIFLFHILTRNIDMRMRNNISGFIQDSKQHSLLPYHLICLAAAENILLQSILLPLIVVLCGIGR